MGIIENAKEIADLIKKIDDIELYKEIVELESEIIDLTRVVRQKEDRISELEKSLKTSKRIHFHSPFYFAEEESDPYCSRCWETDGIAVHVIYHGEYSSGYRYVCPHCKNDVFVEERAER